MVVSEQSERSEIFALLRQKHIYISIMFFIPTRKPENQKLTKKLYILIASEPKFLLFLGLKHTILLNILLINPMACRYNKLCPCDRNTRDMVLFMMIYSDQKTRNSRKTHK